MKPTQSLCPCLLPGAVINITKGLRGGKGLPHFVLPGHNRSLREVRARTPGRALGAATTEELLELAQGSDHSQA